MTDTSPAPISDTDRLYASLGPLPSPTGTPALIVLSGLPGSGKSYFCRQLAALLPSLVTLETDSLRGILFADPTHSGGENARLFRAIHRLMERLLAEGHTIALDATNLIRKNRRRLYRIAEQTGASLLILELTAPESVIRQRLSQREAHAAAGQATDDNSTAGIDVYERMIRSAQPIRRDHITVDTSQDIGPALTKVVAQQQQSNKPTVRDGI